MTDVDVYGPEAPFTPPTESPPSPSGPDRPRSPGRRWLVLAALVAVALAAAALVATSDRSGESTVSTGIDDGTATEPGLTTSTTEALTAVDPVATPTTAAPPAAAAPAPATPATSEPIGTEIAKDPAGEWTLYYADSTRCAALVVGDKTYPKLLCGASPASPADVIGEVATVETSRLRRVMVATVDRRVNGLSAYPRGGGGNMYYDTVVATPPSAPELRLIAGVVAQSPVDLKVRSDIHVIARVVLPAGFRHFARAELERVVTPPYGEWKDYRRVAFTGFYMGGDQELGFYSAAGGGACVLYRRLGGAYENVILDGCGTSGGGHLQLATLENIQAEYMPRAFLVVAASDVAGQVTVVLSDGTSLGELNAYPDTASGWIAHAQHVRHVVVPEGVTEVDFVLAADGTEIERVTVKVPAS